MNQGLLPFDSSERLIICNRRYIEMYGLSRDVVKPGCTLRQLLRHRQATGSFHGDVERYCDDVLRNRTSSATAIVEAADGRLIQVRNEPIPEGGWLATHEDVTDRRRSEEKIAHLAHFRRFDRSPQQSFIWRTREAKIVISRTATLCNSLHRCRRVQVYQRIFGHQVGDELLKCIALRLSKTIDPGDLVARLGGDEFAIVKGGIRDYATLQTFVENLYDAIRAPVTCCGHEVTTDASIGIAVAPDHGSSLHELIKNADLAMYDAKSSGRRTFRFFATEMGLRMQARRALEEDFRQAVAAGDFDVRYQPLVDLATNEVAGCEALLRWNHSKRGFFSPSEFIPLAEESA